MFKRKTLAASTTAALLGAGGLLLASGAQAFEQTAIAWDIEYPDSLSDDNADCALCHAVSNPAPDNAPMNPYGAAIDLNLGLPGAFRAIEDIDSDGSGFVNIVEIALDTQPGWTEGDTPPPTVIGDLDPQEEDLGPDIDVDPLTLDFGIVPITSFETRETTVSNLGTEVLTIESLTLTGDTVFMIGVNVPVPPFDIESGSSRPVGVRCDPVEPNVTYTGTLLIGSNDPDEPEVSVALTCTGGEQPQGCAPVPDPAELDFGEVEVTTSLALSTTVRNVGTEDCVDVEAVVRPIAIPQEFILLSEPIFSIPAEDSVDVMVEYAPVDVGEDQGRIEMTFPDQTVSVPLSGVGVGLVCDDCDIYRFRATPQVRLSNQRPAFVRMSVENNGDNDGAAEATVVGVQNGVEVYREVLTVSDPMGGGVTTYTFPPYLPTETGQITWTGTLVDDDPDEDTAEATTIVVE